MHGEILCIVDFSVHLFYLQKENRPFLRGPLDGMFVFKGFLVGTKVDRMAQVFALFENMDNGAPSINILDRLGSVHSLVKSCQMHR